MSGVLNMNKELLKNLQLMAGGSFYPDINPDIQERFAKLILLECIDICDKGSTTQMTSLGAAGMIKQRFGIN